GVLMLPVSFTPSPFGAVLLRAPYFSASVCLFFYSSVHLRDLHSFPTRRSSDLISRERAYEIFWPVLVGSLVGGRLYYERANQNRSEEHTSELQSQSNLVCRLLLEKKKKLMGTPLRVLHMRLVGLQGVAKPHRAD